MKTEFGGVFPCCLWLLRKLAQNMTRLITFAEAAAQGLRVIWWETVANGEGITPNECLGSVHITAGHTEERGRVCGGFKREIHSTLQTQDTEDEKSDTLSFQHDIYIAFPKSNHHLNTFSSFTAPSSTKISEQPWELKPYSYIQKHRACLRHREAMSLKCLRQRKQVNLDFSYF